MCVCEREKKRTKGMMNTYSRAAGIFVRGNSLCLPCFSSSRSAVFVGAYDDDAATSENGWWDFFFSFFLIFYWRTGSVGHKMCLRFPRRKKKEKEREKKMAHLPCQSRRRLRELGITWSDAERLLCRGAQDVQRHMRAQTNAASRLACFSR